jgi:hypothetical protein
MNDEFKAWLDLQYRDEHENSGFDMGRIAEDAWDASAKRFIMPPPMGWYPGAPGWWTTGETEKTLKERLAKAERLIQERIDWDEIDREQSKWTDDARAFLERNSKP